MELQPVRTHPRPGAGEPDGILLPGESWLLWTKTALDIWLWVKSRVAPRWLALANGYMD